MPKFTTQQYASALFDAVRETKPESHDLVLDNFVKILAQNGDLNKHSEIEEEYKKLEMKKKGIKQVEITVAREMEVNKGILDDLNALVGNGFKPFPTLEIKTQVDESIVGGMVVRVDDTLIDASIKTQLTNLNYNLRN